MPPIVTNSLWTVVTFVLASLGVSYEPSDSVKATVAAGGALLVAVIQWQQHRTIRHHTDAAATVAIARAANPPAPVMAPPIPGNSPVS
jgi:DNA-binding transcriptional LysR family regulator